MGLTDTGRRNPQGQRIFVDEQGRHQTEGTIRFQNQRTEHAALSDIAMRRILRGEYSDAPIQPDPSKPQAPTLSKVQQLALQHPAWPEYASLPAPVRERAFGNDFSRFLYCREHGLLPQLQASVEKAIEEEMREELQAKARRETEQAIKNAESEDPERYRAMMDRIQGNPNYPGLQRA